MKKFFYLIVLFFCIFLVPQYLKATATIAGTVTDSISELPIAGALVEAVKGNQVRFSTITAGDGTYTLSGIQPSNYTLIISASGYQTQSVGVNPRNNQTTIVDIALIPNGGTISGTVINAITTLPIVGATVTIFQGTIFITSAATDGSGFYSVPNLTPDNYIVLVAAAGFDTDTQGAHVEIGTTTIVNFALSEPPGIISGTITDSSTNPILGALVEVYVGSIVVGFADTDASGNYQIPDLAPGSYTVVATSMTYQSQAVGAIVVANTVTTVNFIMDPNPGSIAGTVTDISTSNPIPGATIAVFQGATLIETLLTDTNGDYVAPDLTPGNYIVVANATDFEIDITGAIVTPNTTATANFTLTPEPGIIAGIVTDAITTEPIAGATIQVFDSVILIATALTDASGNYQIANLAPGSYTVVVNKKNYQIQAIEAIVTSNTSTMVNFALVFNPGTISGTITDVTHNPIPSATVIVSQGMTLINSTLTDINGNYIISDLAPGTYFVVVTAQNFQAAFTTTVVAAGLTTSADFELNPLPGTITGTITDACSGNPVNGAIVLITNGQMVIGFSVSDSSGVYVIPDLSPGDYTVTIIKRNFLTNSSTAFVMANTTTIQDFTLAPVALPPATITGSLSCDKYLTQTDYIRVISWTASPSSCISSYSIFRDGIQIASVSSSTFKFVDCNCNRKAFTYSVRMVDSLGQVSDPVSITIKGA